MYYCKRCRTWHKGGKIAKAHRLYGDPNRKPKGKARSVKKMGYKPKITPERKKIVAGMNKEFDRMIEQGKQERKERKVTPVAKKISTPKRERLASMVDKPKTKITITPYSTPALARKFDKPKSNAKARLTRELGSLGKLDLFRKKIHTVEKYVKKEKELKRKSETGSFSFNDETELFLVQKRKPKAIQAMQKYKSQLSADPGFSMTKEPFEFNLKYSGKFVTATKKVRLDQEIPWI